MSTGTLNRWAWISAAVAGAALFFNLSVRPRPDSASATPSTTEHIARLEIELAGHRAELAELRSRVILLEETQRTLSSHVEGVGFTRPSWAISPSLASRIVTPNLELRPAGVGSTLSANFQYRGTCPRSVFVKVVGFDGRAFVAERISLEDCSFTGLELGRPSYDVSQVEFSP